MVPTLALPQPEGWDRGAGADVSKTRLGLHPNLGPGVDKERPLLLLFPGPSGAHSSSVMEEGPGFPHGLSREGPLFKGTFAAVASEPPEPILSGPQAPLSLQCLPSQSRGDPFPGQSISCLSQAPSLKEVMQQVSPSLQLWGLDLQKLLHYAAILGHLTSASLLSLVL